MARKCVNCGAICQSNKQSNKSPRCRKCWQDWIREDPSRGPSFKRGSFVYKGGYIAVLARDHPNAFTTGYILEHRLVMANHLGRSLKKGEIVHHINGITNDNRIENLVVCTRMTHTKLHKRTTTCRICGKPERCKGLCKNHYANARYWASRNH